MGVKAELSSFLNHLPGVDGPGERKVLLTFTGQSELGIYLELTYLVIPGLNDSEDEIKDFVIWVRDELDPRLRLGQHN